MQNLLELFENCVIGYSDSVAISYGKYHLSFGMLNNAANKVASLIQEIAPKTSFIAVCCHPSFEYYISLLGILKAGYAFLSLDPNIPEMRQHAILKDAAVELALISSSNNDKFSTINIKKLIIDNISYHNHDYHGCIAIKRVTKEDLAYAVYTSGTTGNAKGIKITHHALANLIMVYHKLFEIVGPHNRILQFFSPSFDASIAEWVIALTQTATLCLTGNSKQFLGDDLLQFFKHQQITHAFLTPSVSMTLHSIKDTWIKKLFLAGELLSLQAIPSHNANQQIYNAYGLSETTICASNFLIDDRYPINTIGNAIQNSQFYLLDDNLSEVVLNEIGEIYVGGYNLCAGYINNDELNATQFLVSPFAKDNGMRLFRTGDLGRYIKPDIIEYIGRIDDQIQIRGYRVEPRDVEICLERYPAIQCAVVIKQVRQEHDQYLAAYIKFQQVNISCNVEALKEFMATQLPEYMIPQQFYRVESFPLTMSQKIDRKLLPLQNHALLLSDNVATACNDNIVEKLRDIWAAHLNISKKFVANDKHYFALGGTSIGLVTLKFAIEQEFNLTLQMVDLFKHPTLLQLAEFIKQSDLVTQ